MSKLIFPILIRIAIGVFVYFLLIEDGIYKGQKEFNRRDWVTIDGKIVKLILKEKLDKDGSKMVSKMYVNTFLRYSFTFEKVNYIETEAIELNQLYPRNSIEELTVAKEKNYPSGKTIKIRVNPKYIGQSTSMDPSYEYIIVELALGLMAELFLIYSIIKKLRKKS